MFGLPASRKTEKKKNKTVLKESGRYFSIKVIIWGKIRILLNFFMLFLVSVWAPPLFDYYIIFQCLGSLKRSSGPWHMSLGLKSIILCSGGCLTNTSGSFYGPVERLCFPAHCSLVAGWLDLVNEIWQKWVATLRAPVWPQSLLPLALDICNVSDRWHLCQFGS